MGTLDTIELTILHSTRMLAQIEEKTEQLYLCFEEVQSFELRTVFSDSVLGNLSRW